MDSYELVVAVLEMLASLPEDQEGRQYLVRAIRLPGNIPEDIREVTKLAFTVPYTLTGIPLGPEFPSLLGALVGLAIVVAAARRRFLLPKDTWDFAPASEWQPEWLGRIEMKRNYLPCE